MRVRTVTTFRCSPRITTRGRGFIGACKTKDKASRRTSRRKSGMEFENKLQIGRCKQRRQVPDASLSLLFHFFLSKVSTKSAFVSRNSSLGCLYNIFYAVIGRHCWQSNFVSWSSFISVCIWIWWCMLVHMLYWIYVCMHVASYNW